MQKQKGVPVDKSSQRKRFEQTARELGVDLDEEKLKEALRRMAKERAADNGDSKDDSK